MASLKTKEICYWSCPRIERPENDEYVDGNQRYIQHGYSWYKLVWLWYARETKPSETEISNEITQEFYPNSSYVFIDEPFSGNQMEQEDLPYLHIPLLGIRLHTNLSDLNGATPYSFVIGQASSPKYAVQPLGDGTQNPQLLGHYKDILYQVRWAAGSEEGSSDITLIINQKFHPTTDYIFDPQSILRSIRPVIPKSNTFGKYDFKMQGRYLNSV